MSPSASSSPISPSLPLCLNLAITLSLSTSLSLSISLSFCLSVSLCWPPALSPPLSLSLSLSVYLPLALALSLSVSLSSSPNKHVTGCKVRNHWIIVFSCGTMIHILIKNLWLYVCCKSAAKYTLGASLMGNKSIQLYIVYLSGVGEGVKSGLKL